MDHSKTASNVKAKLKAMESALLQLSKENNSYKAKIHLLSEQKIELIGFLHAKNDEISSLQKQLTESISEYDEKINRQEPNTLETSSMSRNQSDSIVTLLKLLDIPIIGSRYTEENLKSLLRKFEAMISKNKKASEDNASLRCKLDEVNPYLNFVCKLYFILCFHFDRILILL